MIDIHIHYPLCSRVPCTICHLLGPEQQFLRYVLARKTVPEFVRRFFSESLTSHAKKIDQKEYPTLLFTDTTRRPTRFLFLFLSVCARLKRSLWEKSARGGGRGWQSIFIHFFGAVVYPLFLAFACAFVPARRKRNRRIVRPQGATSSFYKFIIFAHHFLAGWRDKNTFLASAAAMMRSVQRDPIMPRWFEISEAPSVFLQRFFFLPILMRR